jgi:hypothetical protein
MTAAPALVNTKVRQRRLWQIHAQSRQNKAVPVTRGGEAASADRGGGMTLVSVQDARSALADQCLAEFRLQALQIMQHTCAELSAGAERETRPSLRARVGWKLVDLGLRLASERRRHLAP